jgi:hypothetical protein
MKRFFLTFLFFVALGISFSFSSIENNTVVSNEANIENYECKYGQCHATAKSTGKRCKHCVSNKGDSNCWQHK